MKKYEIFKGRSHKKYGWMTKECHFSNRGCTVNQHRRLQSISATGPWPGRSRPSKISFSAVQRRNAALIGPQVLLLEKRLLNHNLPGCSIVGDLSNIGLSVSEHIGVSNSQISVMWNDRQDKPFPSLCLGAPSTQGRNRRRERKLWWDVPSTCYQYSYDCIP